MALHSYVSDTTSKERRTAKLGKLLAMNFFGFFFGSLVAGFALDTIGFNVTFAIVVFLNFIAFLLALFFMNEREFEIESDEITKSGAETTHKGRSGSMFLFNIRNVQESLSVITKPRQDHLRGYIVILFVTLIVQQTCKSGENDVMLLFVEKTPLNWKKSTYAYLLATDYGCLGLCVMFLLPLLSYYLRVADIVIVIIGISFKIVRTMTLTVSDKTWMIFLSVVIGAPSSMMVGGAKSIISKTVSEDEIGKTFSLLSCCETVSNLIGAVLFTNVYAATFEVFDGFSFVLEAFIFFLLLIVITLMAREMRINSTYLLIKDVAASGTITESGNEDDSKTKLVNDK